MPKTKKSSNKLKTFKNPPPKIILSSLLVLAIAIIATANFSIFNNPISNIGSSNASAQEPADINNDNKVDIFDLSTLLSKWNSSDALSDLNKDNIVSIFDLSILLSKWGVVGVINDNLFLDGFFPIGVYVQWVDSFDKWKGRGINTLVGVPDGNDANLWSSEARSKGLKMIRGPVNETADANDPMLIAWDTGDEPELNGTSASEVVADYNRLKAVAPNKPVFVNFAGGFVLEWQGDCNASCYAQYLPGADWVSSDIYPVAGWGSSDIGAVGRAVKTLASWDPNKPQFAFIATGDQNLPWAQGLGGPTPDQVRAEIWDAIINGARGYAYFPVGLSPWSWDTTPTNVASEMTKQNGIVTSLAPILQSRINPTNINATVSTPLEVAWRMSQNEAYFIILNLSDTAKSNQSISLDGIGSVGSATVYQENRTVSIINGRITDNFAPYAVHIYKVQM